MSETRGETTKVIPGHIRAGSCKITWLGLLGKLYCFSNPNKEGTCRKKETTDRIQNSHLRAITTAMPSDQQNNHLHLPNM